VDGSPLLGLFRKMRHPLAHEGQLYRGFGRGHSSLICLVFGEFREIARRRLSV